MMLLWASAGVPLGVYNIVEQFNIALRIQAQILTFLSLLTWSQCYHYGKGWSVGKCAVILLGMCTLMGGIEAGLIFALRVSPDNDHIPSIRQYRNRQLSRQRLRTISNGLSHSWLYWQQYSSLSACFAIIVTSTRIAQYGESALSSLVLMLLAISFP